MAGRVNSDLLLVGSLPADSTRTAFSSAGPLFGDLVFALPDGETGARAAWVGYERNQLFQPHPDLELVSRPSSPDGIPRHAYDAPAFTVRSGVYQIHFDHWPRIDEALESYTVFRSVRDDGAIPPGTRFQVGLPSPGSAITGGFKTDFAADYPVLERAYEDLARQGLERLTQEIPAEDLAIQWDVCYEVLDLEGVLAWTADGAWERFAGPAARLSPLIPDDVLVGYHFCYGTFPEWPMFEARDMELIVRMANAAVELSGRPVDWVHLAGPRYLRCEDDRFFQPLGDLDVGDARVFLGIVLPVDGIGGLRRRAATASRHLADFGISMYCGFGRQQGLDPAQTLREHGDVVRTFLGRS